MNALTCQRCGLASNDVRVRLVRYEGRFATEARCVDSKACEIRQAASGFGVRP